MTPELERMFHDIRSRAGDVPGASGDLPSSDELLQRHLHSATVGMLLRALHEFLCIYPSWAACSRAFAAALVMPTVPRGLPQPGQDFAAAPALCHSGRALHPASTLAHSCSQC